MKSLIILLLSIIASLGLAQAPRESYKTIKDSVLETPEGKSFGDFSSACIEALKDSLQTKKLSSRYIDFRI